MNRSTRSAVVAWCCRTFGRASRRLPLLGIGAAAFVAVLAPDARAQTYCTAGSASCRQPAGDERITRVVLNTLESVSDPSVVPAGCYTDLTSLSTSLQRGSSHPITIEYVNTFSGDNGRAFVDWNRDFDFDDAGETFVLTRTPGLFSGTVVVPADAVLGNTRMRVRVTYTGTAPPCGQPSQNYGEVQDFTVTVLAATTGACCFAGSGVCSVTPPGGCSGTYQGDGSSCSPSNPCGGACCTGGSCSVTTASACPAGSVFINNGVCTAESCFYCDAGVVNCGSDGNEIITRVVFANLDNSSPADDFAPCYTDYTSVSTEVSRGATYTLLMEYANLAAADRAAVWIDWNHDFVFGDAASGEEVVLTRAVPTTAVFSGSVTVPANAPLGSVRMRVRLTWSAAPQRCGTNSYGEVEDYTVTVAVATTGACCAPSGACSITTPGGCAGTYQGNATSCTPVNPCGGACCNGGNCTVTTASTCPAGSVFINNRVCTPTACSYCTAGVSSCNTPANEIITRVVFANLDNFSGADPAGPCYTDFTSLSTQVTRGATYAFRLEYEYPSATDVATVWFDWNRDFVFGDAASGEEVGLTRPDANASVFSGSVTVPAGASLGSTRVRVRLGYSTPPPPCGDSTYGEVEDYSLTISAAATGACCAASGACSITAPGGCAGTYQGNATTCTPSNPCGGACCAGESCTVTTAGSCPAGSLFRANGVCTPGVCSYCTAVSAYCNSTGNLLITRVAFVGIDNGSLPDQFAPCYSDFTSVSTQVSRGATYTLLFEYENETTLDVAGVWFDWNRDLVFGDAASGEHVVLTHPDGNGAAFAGNVTVPAGAPLGSTRMRVRVQYAGTPTPCGAANYGEIEDYTVTVSVATTGACCVAGSGACSITAPGGCAGTYQGNATTCSPFNPCGGSCCTAGACAVTTAAACPAGSVFINGAPCGPTSCAYCTAGVANCGSTGNELITRVLFAGIDNASAPDDFAPCSNDYTSVSGQVARGTTYPFLFEYANDTTVDQGTVWFDWNRDFRFGDVASGEQVILTHPDGNPAAFAADVTVPAGASLGGTRMRVRVQWAGTPVACGNNSYGEVEDYTLVIGASSCRADFDRSGTVNVSDIFAFLSAWFSHGAGSDFNNDGVVNVSDIFAFLSAWFAGCP